MKKTIRKSSVQKAVAMAFFAFVLLLAPPVRSEIRKGSFEVNVFGGYNWFANDKNLKDCPMVGGRLGYNLTRHFGIEGSMAFLQSRVGDKSITGEVRGQYRSPMDRVDLTFYDFNVLYHFMPDRRFNPFVVVGIGAIHYDPKISDTDMSTFNFGVGAKYWLAKRLAIRVDLKDNAVGEVFKYTYQNLNATAGLVLSFGGSDKNKPATAAKSKPKPVERVVIVVAEEPEPKIVEKVKIIAVEPKIEEKVIILAFEDVHFDLDKSTLKDSAKTILKRSVQILKDNPKARVRIAGYTSASGTQEYNQDLSERRATAVRDYLVQEGVVSSGRLSTIGFGESNPAKYEAAPTDLYSKAAKANMRVLFEVLLK